MDTAPNTAVIGIDIGGTKMAAYVCDSDYQSRAERVVATPAAAKPTALAAAVNISEAEAAGRAALLAELTALCQHLIAEAAAQNLTVTAIGIGTAGQIDPNTGTVLDANENLIGWKGTPVAATLGAEFGVPVVVDNDVRVMALAECSQGAGRGYAHVLCLTVGTGIGGAIVLNGELWRGAHYSAGEIGYLFATPERNLEQSASGPALEQQYQERAGEPAFIPLAAIVQRAENGDTLARDVLESGARLLGQILSPVMALIDPQAVIIGGGLSGITTLWWEPLRAAIQQSPLQSVREMPVIPAALGNRAGMIGAALLAMQKGNG